MPVQEGDTILVPLVEFEKSATKPSEVVWSQGWSKQKETYVFLNFTVTKKHDGKEIPAGESKGLIFVQLDMADAFKKKKVEGQADLTIVVDKDFQYGQKNKEGEGRWLAYHNKEHKPYQHRFVKTVVEKVGEKVADVAKMLGFESGKALLSDFLGAFGDYLHDY